ncbi:hypothetical protein Pr1d_21490 [Bythopirellula goksoeyrii]|uniref:Uncharacterized protein n=1 Tax=Bythopirellula goksoeyrii TaxID=1400387 RepID=A0A5B9QL50_9BACT|nr:hypothetical protein Pr1d_21490 [Bythopirellula goksoeyrii]
MAVPCFLNLTDETCYRTHFENNYCKAPIMTYDGIAVRFRKKDFDHCCFQSSLRNSDKDTFSIPRAIRLDWIRFVLQNRDAPKYQGWNKKKRCHDPDRRVALEGNYIVVIAMISDTKANFITAYPAEQYAINLVKKGPKWA